MFEVTQTRQANHRGDSSRVGTLIESPLQIATVKLDGSNYLPWSCTAFFTICSHGLYVYLTEVTKEPKVGVSFYDHWHFDNELVMSWHLHSMRLEICQGIAHDIWTIVTHTYSRVGNNAQVYELSKRIYVTQ